MRRCGVDVRRVNASVRIKIAIDRNKYPVLKMYQLSKDLKRLISEMSAEEYNSYKERIR